MYARSLASMGALALAFAFVVTPAAQKRAALRTPWGDPDLQGTWTNGTTIPLERPRELAGKRVLTAEEAARIKGPNADTPPPKGDPGNYNEFWYERGVRSNRTSLIVDPPDGQLPPLTPEGENMAAAQRRGVGEVSPIPGKIAACTSGASRAACPVA